MLLRSTMNDYLSVFRMPTPMKITGRSSSITNSFINSIIPISMPSSEVVGEALAILKMDIDSIECSYCGSTYTEWDHLRPLVMNQKPTGFISEIHNLVPSCGKCNQSKGNKAWDTWIVSDAPLSPKTRGIADLDARVKALRNYENWGSPTRVNFEEIVGTEKWALHWENWQRVIDSMKNAQLLANEINETVKRRAL